MKKNALRPRALTGIAAVLTAAIALTACGSETKSAGTPSNAANTVKDPIVTTYDGGLYVLDGESLKVAKDIPLDGFIRINPAGNDRHMLVSTGTGFRVLDALSPELTSIEYKGSKPGHVVRHAGRTVLFADGTGEVTILDSKTVGEAKAATRTYKSAAPHHGVAIELENGELVTTLGTEEKRVGILVLDKDHKEIARNESCPGVHGETTAKGEVVVIGCQDGVLIYKGGAITKVKSPTAYGRIGNQSGSDTSPIVLGDYKKDADAELERPEQVSLINTETGTLKLVDLGTSYTFRSLGRGPQDQALVLGTDGQIHVIDPEAAKVTKTIPVIKKWTEPLEWQEARPALFVRGGTAYVSDPTTKNLYAIDIAAGKVVTTVPLPKAPNELSGIRH
ncbi:zinc metallochaperone AztD [Kribbella sp. NPDC056345]|uniref:zinc metallochaperone AztD n=1 Tax=Kribbella sp. NPDC056345 TaxID=3345789 RepID=UPI0035DA9DC9